MTTWPLLLALAIAVSLLVAGVIVSVRAHDTGLDGGFVDSTDPAHECYHRQVEYWDRMIDYARANMELLCHRHAPLPVGHPRLAEFRREVVQVLERGMKSVDRFIARLNARAKELGRDLSRDFETLNRVEASLLIDQLKDDLKDDLKDERSRG